MTASFDELKLTGTLPTPAGVGMTILRITQRDDYSAEEISRAVRSDPALTGRILKVANSAATAGLKPVATVNDAVVRLGARTVGNIALGFTLISAYRDGACRAFDYRRYWSQSLARAVASHALATHVGHKAPAEAYICGLLSGVGRLALACVHPEAYSRVLRACRDGSEDQLAALESKAFGIDHRELAVALLEDWQLPASYGNAIAGKEHGAGEPQLRGLLVVAAAIAELCLAADGTHARHWHELNARRPLLEVSEDALAGVCARIVAEWQQWGRTLDIETRAVPPLADIRAAAAAAAAAATAMTLAPGAPEKPVAREPVDPRDLLDDAAAAAWIGENDPLTVLVVDDDPVDLATLCGHLEGGGFRALRATRGDEALKMALDAGPHLLVTKDALPGMSGLELTRSLRRIHGGKDVFILLTVERNKEDDAVEAFDAGIDDYVLKPFDARVLMSRIGAGERAVRLHEKILRDKRRMERDYADLCVMRRKLQVLSVRDPLTDLFNRAKAMDLLEEHWQRNDRSLSVIVLDIDALSLVNDEGGHTAGDHVLKEAARIFRASVRKNDVLCRLDGEEFLVICPGADLEAAGQIAERLRSGLASQRFRVGVGERHVTCSLGVAERSGGMPHHDHLLTAAGQAVLRAKEEGKDRVVHAVAR